MADMEGEFFLIPKGDELTMLRKKLNQDEEKIEHCLGLFLNWVSYQKHLPQTYDVNFMKNMITACKNDVEKAKRRYESYCYAKIVHSQFVQNRIITPEGDLKCLEYIHVLPFPKITPDGCRLVALKVFNMDEYNLMEITRYITLLADYVCSKDVQLAGLVVLFDGEIVKAKHYPKIFTPLFLKCIRLAIGFYPVRASKIVIISCDPFLQKGVNLCKSILPQKIVNRIIMVRDARELQEYYPTSCLPSDYGGSLKSMKELCDQWRKFIMENEEFFQKVHQDVPTGPIPKAYEVDENNFGINGSFRKLNID